MTPEIDDELAELRAIIASAEVRRILSLAEKWWNRAYEHLGALVESCGRPEWVKEFRRTWPPTSATCLRLSNEVFKSDWSRTDEASIKRYRNTRKALGVVARTLHRFETERSTAAAPEVVEYAAAASLVSAGTAALRDAAIAGDDDAKLGSFFTSEVDAQRSELLA